MGSGSRREFLKSCLASASVLAAAGHAEALQIGMQAHAQAGPRLARYVDPLPIPPRMQPHGKRGDTAQYRVRMVEFEGRLHSQLPPTRLWGYEGHYPGPVFEAMRGQPVEVEWRNELPREHLFPVDTHIHGAMPPAPAVRTVPHLHGSRTDSISDGLPEKWFTPGHGVVYRYPNEQQAATLWYHDHAAGITRLNVYAGLSGFYLLRDEQELRMNLPSGEYEIPLTLQDRFLDEQGRLLYAPTQDSGAPLPQGVWGPLMFGNVPVANGAIYPYLEVEPRRYRFRVLNGCNSRFYRLYLNLAPSPTDPPRVTSFHQIGSDGGLLAEPVEMQRLLLAPAERADLVIDFSGLQGKTVTLCNDAAAPYPGWDVLRQVYAALNELMQFRVTKPLAGNAKTFSLPRRVDVPRMQPAEAQVTRDFVLTAETDKQGNTVRMLINGRGYDAPVTEMPKLGTMEKWRFFNMTDDAHPMHLHLVQYQIQERQGFNPAAMAKGRVEFVGRVRPPAANEAGWKDTAVVLPQESLTILVRFEGFTGKYVYHCHMAEHEDNDMMRPFVVVQDSAGPQPES